MVKPLNRILILADLEGSSACWSYAASSFMTTEWARACLGMSRDVASVVGALFEAGVQAVTVKDFHRTGYNLLPELIDPRAVVVSGYRRGPIPGIGEPGNVQAVMFLGMHAASGSGGFLAHTLTSRLARLVVNGRLLAEVELFAASLAPWGIRPVFFSGCPVACEQASAVIEKIGCFPIDKSGGPQNFDSSVWRSGLAEAAVEALSNEQTEPYMPTGPFEAQVTIRQGTTEAARLARRWQFQRNGAQILIRADQMRQLYLMLIKLCYLNPAVERILPLALMVSNLRGRLGIGWARRHLNRQSRFF